MTGGRALQPPFRRATAAVAVSAVVSPRFVLALVVMSAMGAIGMALASIVSSLVLHTATWSTFARAALPIVQVAGAAALLAWNRKIQSRVR